MRCILGEIQVCTYSYSYRTAAQIIRQQKKKREKVNKELMPAESEIPPLTCLFLQPLSSRSSIKTETGHFKTCASRQTPSDIPNETSQMRSHCEP